MKRIVLCNIIALLIGLNAFGQDNFPEKEPVFVDTEVVRVDIIMNPADLQTMLETLENEYEFPAVFVFTSSQRRDTVENVGFRLRGNTSLHSAKKSFKISFNSFVSGQKYFGLEKMNLNGEHNDPTIMRSKLSWEICRAFNVVSSRANFAALYINNQYYGVYINTEHIDEEFADLRFGNQDGNLYKCLYPADLGFISNDPNSYKFSGGDGERAYDLKTNIETDDYSDLAHFIDVLNNTPSSEFYQALDEVLNVNSYLRYLVIEVITGHWDGYSVNKNNYYLYHNTQTDKFEFIPYDMDNTYGIDWFSVDWAMRNIYNWSADWENRPLYQKVLANAIYRKRFTFYMEQFLTEVFNADFLFPKIDVWKNLITPFAEADPFRALDYGWSMTYFNNSYTQALNTGHVTYGLKPYITTRYSSATAMLESTNVAPIIEKVWTNTPAFQDNIIFYAKIEDDTQVAAQLHYSINGSQELSVDMLLENGIYKATISPVMQSATITYYATASDISSNTSRAPITGEFSLHITQATVSNLFVNEIMASNSETLPDEFGEYDDWIEIYNAGTTNIYLGDKYLSDNLQNPDKWQFPPISIAAGEFIIFWADEQQEQGSNHTSFKLNKSGEEVGIFDSETNGFALINAMTYAAQEQDISYARYPDGTGNWVYCIYPSPGFPNIYTSTDELNAEIFDFKIFPNPFNSILNLSVQHKNIEEIYINLYDIQGKVIYSNNFENTDIQINTLSINNLEAGLYLLNCKIKTSNNIWFSLPAKRVLKL